MRWTEFKRVTGSLGLSRAVQRDTAGVRSRVLGHVNLTALFLSVDECTRHLESFDRSLDIWVSTEAGAVDAVQFAAAAERAYRTHEIAELPHRITRVPCSNCGLVLVWQPPAWFEQPVVVRCGGCGVTVDQDVFEEMVTPPVFRFGCTGCGCETPARAARADALDDLGQHRCLRAVS